MQNLKTKETIINIKGMEQDSEKIIIETNLRKIFMSHEQDCCESVFVEDVVGNVDKHIGAELFDIDEKVSSEPLGGDNEYESFTYTFYTIKTSKGYLDVRWVGSSNGYYSESVDIESSYKKLKEVEKEEQERLEETTLIL